MTAPGIGALTRFHIPIGSDFGDGGGPSEYDDGYVSLGERLRRVGLLPETPDFRVSPYCMGFRNFGPKDAITTRIAAPMIPFRILGLMVWGATDESMIVRCQVGNLCHLLASAEPIPALFFAAGLSFDELLAQLADDEGEPLPVRNPGERLEPQEFFRGWLEEHPKVEPRQLLRFDTLSIGSTLTIDTTGPLHQLVVWGDGLRD